MTYHDTSFTVDGGLTQWSAWGACTVTCGGGKKYQTRTCTSPTPQYGGAPCTGATSRDNDCNTQVCISKYLEHNLYI